MKNGEDIAKQFEERWNFPNCLGAIDGKHIILQPPATSGSFYYNYKHTYSIVLLAFAGIWNKNVFLKAVEGNRLAIPPDTTCVCW